LHNKAILKSFALGMVKNAHDQELFNYYTYQFNEEQTHPDLAKKFGLALGLKEEDFADATQIFECQIHSARTIYNTLTGGGPLSRASALTSESMVCRYSEEFNTYLRKNYGLGDDALTFFTAHGRRQGAHCSICRAHRPGCQNHATSEWCARVRSTWCGLLGKFEEFIRPTSDCLGDTLAGPIGLGPRKILARTSICILLDHAPGAKAGHSRADRFLHQPKPTSWYFVYVAIIKGWHDVFFKKLVKRFRVGCVHGRRIVGCNSPVNQPSV
jgi:hypothetical protein